jgi:hypothetical protein
MLMECSKKAFIHMKLQYLKTLPRYLILCSSHEVPFAVYVAIFNGMKSTYKCFEGFAKGNTDSFTAGVFSFFGRRPRFFRVASMVEEANEAPSR